MTLNIILVIRIDQMALSMTNEYSTMRHISMFFSSTYDVFKSEGVIHIIFIVVNTYLNFVWLWIS